MKTKHKFLAATAAVGLVLTVLLPPPAPVLGHGGEDHGEAAQASTGVALTDEVLLPKESQFLFEVRTNLARGAKITLQNPEDAQLKWAVTEQEPGIYLVEGQFPANKAYSFTANIVAGDRADLLLLEGIKVGEKLPVADGPAATAPSIFSSWKTILLLVGAFLLGIGLTALLLRRRAVPPVAAPVSTSTPVVYENQA